MKGNRVWSALLALCLAACGDGSVQSPAFTPVLTGISIDQPDGEVFVGESLSFTATGTFTTAPGSSTTESSQAVTPSWSISNTSVATVDGSGEVTGVAAGSVTLTATLDGFSSEVEVTVNALDLVGITIDPASATVAVDGTVTFTVTGTYQGTGAPVTGPVEDVEWSSDDEAVASIDAEGVATGHFPGSATITASADGVQDTATLSVTYPETLIGLAVTPDPASSPLGREIQFTATGTYATAPGPNPPTVTHPVAQGEVTWSVSPATIATIDATRGIATGIMQGTATVTATRGAISDSAVLTVGPPVLEAVIIVEDIDPVTEAQDKTVPRGTTQDYVALGYYSDSDSPRVLDTNDPVTDTLVWTTTDADVVTVAPTDDPSMVATAVGEGAATLTVTVGAEGQFQDRVTLTVGAAQLTGLARVEPPTARVVPEASVEFQAIGSYTDGSERPLSDAQVDWTSGTPAVATIDDATGIATGVTQGVSTITATLVGTPGVSGSANATLTVTDPVCTTPLLASENATAAADPVGLCLLCNVENPEAAIDASKDSFASINVPVGLLDAGESLTVTAHDNLSYDLPLPGGDTVGFIVSRPVGTLLTAELFSQLEISTLLNGAVQQTTGPTIPLRLDLLGMQLIGGVNSEQALASLTTTMPYDAVRLTLVSGVASALTSLDVHSACATVELPPPAAELEGIVRVESTVTSLPVGSSVEMLAIGRYADGTEAALPDGDLDWSTSDASRATVNATGVVTSVAAGAVEITATLKPGVSALDGDARSASATINVAAQVCTVPMTADAGATVADAVGGLCLFCNAADTANVIDTEAANYATIGVPLGALGASVSVTVTDDEQTAAPQTPGFIIGRPAGEGLLLLELGSQISISTLLDGDVQETSGELIPLRLELLGTQIVSDGDTALASINATRPYDALRLTFNSGLASALTGLRVYSACSVSESPGAAN